MFLRIMSDLVARTGRLKQRYEAGCRLVAGCIPYRYRKSDDAEDGDSEKMVEVLMISSPSGPGLLFPKGGWENDETVEEAAVRESMEEAGVGGTIMGFIGYYQYNSKTYQSEFCPEGLCKAAMFALLVTEELNAWPEQSFRSRSWLPMAEAVKQCRHPWMEEALEDSFSKWLATESSEGRNQV